MNERSLPTSECKLQAFYAMNVRMSGLLRAARNDKAAALFSVTCNCKADRLLPNSKIKALNCEVESRSSLEMIQ